MSDAPDPAATLRTALKRKDLDHTESALTELEEASLPELLEQLQTAIQEKRYVDARVVLSRIESHYQERKTVENKIIGRVQAVRTAPKTEFEQLQDLSGYLRTATATKLQRTALLSRVRAFLTAENDTVEPAAAKETITDTKTQEKQFTDATNEVESRTADVSAPPSIALPAVSMSASPIQKGTTADLSATVTNVGDSSASTITIDVSLPAGLSSDTTSISVGDVSGSESVTKTVAVTGTQTGTYSVSVSTTSKNAGDAVETNTVTVTDDLPIDEALDADDNKRIDNSEILQAIEYWQKNEPVPGTGGRTISDFQILKLIEMWRTNAEV